MGIISGYPVGAKIISDFKEKNICTPVECERLLSFTNNSGPLFIVGTCGVSLFYDTKTGILLLITHILACLTVGFLFRWWKNPVGAAAHSRPGTCGQMSLHPQYININNLGKILSDSIISSINTVLLIGGFVVLFSVLLSILSPIFNIICMSNNYATGIASGIIELTNGVFAIGNIVSKNVSIKIIICSFLIGFGGISVLLQVLSITSKSHISIKPYIIGKILQGCFAALYTFLSLQNFPIFNLDL